MQQSVLMFCDRSFGENNKRINLNNARSSYIKDHCHWHICDGIRVAGKLI